MEGQHVDALVKIGVEGGLSLARAQVEKRDPTTKAPHGKGLAIRAKCHGFRRIDAAEFAFARGIAKLLFAPRSDVQNPDGMSRRTFGSKHFAVGATDSC